MILIDQYLFERFLLNHVKFSKLLIWLDKLHLALGSRPLLAKLMLLPYDGWHQTTSKINEETQIDALAVQTGNFGLH